jgi:hypothetical protein
MTGGRRNMRNAAMAKMAQLLRMSSAAMMKGRMGAG